MWIKKKLKNKTTLIKFKNHGSYHIRNFIEDNIKIISDNLIGSPCNKIYKSEIIKRYNIKFKNDLEYAEDLIFNYNYLINIKKVFVIEDCLYNYTRYSNNSLSSKFREDCYENLNYVYDETISLLNKFNIEKHKINNKFANIYIALVNHLYRVFFAREISSLLQKFFPRHRWGNFMSTPATLAAKSHMFSADSRSLLL